MAADEEGEEAEAEAQKLQKRVREAKLRAKLAKEQEKSQLAQERKVGGMILADDDDACLSRVTGAVAPPGQILRPFRLRSATPCPTNRF